MSDFKTALGAFFTGDIDLEGLQRALAEDLQAHPENAAERAADLDRLFSMGRLPAQIHGMLRQQIAGPATAAPPQGQPPQQPPSYPPQGQPPQQPPSYPPQGQPPQQPPSYPPQGQPPQQPPSYPPQGQPPQQPPSYPPQGQPPQQPPSYPPQGQPPQQPPSYPPQGQPPSEAPEPNEDATRLRAPPGEGGAPYPPTPGDDPGSAATVLGPGAATGGVTGTSAPLSAGITGATGTAGTTGPTGSSWRDPDGWAAQPNQVLGVGAVVKQRFVLEEVLGQGGMGTVYKARDLRFEEADDRNPYVALKVLTEEFKRHPKSLVALHREARKSQSLAHPNIVTVYDFDRDGGTVYITMELLIGKPMNELIQEHKLSGMARDDALPLIRGMGRALSYAHRKNIIHSDFKPGNAFLTEENIVKVLDFGIARAAPKGEQAEQEKTRFDVREEIGGYTLAYASLEMLEDLEPDPRDDIYALACTSYELMAGRHPFGKLSAAQAMEADIKAKRIKGLTRTQWKALCHGLAFRRDDRTESVDKFLEELEPAQRRFGLVAGAAAAGVATLLVGGGVFTKRVMDDNRVERLQGALRGDDASAIGSALDETTILTEELRLRVLGPSDIQRAVVDYYHQQIGDAMAAPNYDFTRATTLLETFRDGYSFSTFMIPDFTSEIERQRNEALIDIQQRYNDLLAQRLLLDDPEADDINDVITVLRNVDSDFDPAQDQQLIDAFLEAARAAADSEAADYGKARALLTQGLQYRPDDVLLGNYADEVQLREQEQARLARLDELRETLSTREYESLRDFRTVERDFQDLASIAPDEPVLAKMRAQLASMLNSSVDASITARQWDGASQELNQYAIFLSDDDLQTARARVADARKAHEDQIQTLFSSATQAVDARDFEQAERQLLALTEAGADEALVQQGRDLIGQAYLADARTARSAQDWERARLLARAGLDTNPGASVGSSLNKELTFIDTAEQAERSGEEAAQRQQRLARIQAIEAEFETGLQAQSFDVSSARALQPLLDELAGLDGSNELLAQGPRRVGERLAAQAQSGAATDVEAALKMARDGLALVPQSDALSAAIRQIEARRSSVEQELRERDLQVAKDDLERLVAQRRVDDEDWAGELRAAIQSIAASSGDQAWAETMNTRVARAYLDVATQRRLNNSLSGATALIERAASFAPQLPGLAAEQQLVTAAAAELERESQVKARLAELEKRKKNVLRLAGALQVSAARKEFETLQDELSEQDAFLREEAPAAFARAYAQLAANQVRNGEFDKALAFTAEGLRYRPGDQELSAAQARYENASAVAAALADTAPLPSDIAQRVDTLRAPASRWADMQRAFEGSARQGVSKLGSSDRAQAERRADTVNQLFGYALSVPRAPAVVTEPVAPPPTPDPVRPDPDPIERELANLLAGAAALDGGRLQARLQALRDAAGADFARRSAALAATGLAALKATSDAAAAQQRHATLLAIFPSDAGIRGWQPPVVAVADPCKPELAGYGGRLRYTCRDTLPQQATGPVLVVVPDGQVGGFAVTKYEVSIGDFNTYCRLSGNCNAMSGAAELPVTGVSLADAERYATWLSAETGHGYRIPTKNEWQYAAGAGGSSPGSNFNCQLRVSGKLIRGTGLEPVTHNDQNGWGLLNHVGNAQEWVRSGGSIEAVGGSYSDSASNCSTQLAKPHDGAPDEKTGFRLVRDLNRG